MIDLLRHPVFSVAVSGRRRDFSLAGALAALSAADEIEAFTALRPHQRFAWHAFLVQLAAHALEMASRVEPPDDEDSWRELLRGLTREWPGDEPWNLVVEDVAKPAFLQPPVPEGSLAGWSEVATADDLDILVTSKNHGVKTGQAAGARAEEWVYALVSVQTGGGYEGAGIYGVVRMNGGYSSRPGIGLASSASPGARFRRDLRVLFTDRERFFEHEAGFREEGHRLLWLLPWKGEKGEPLSLSDLHPWFVEICRRIRFRAEGDGFRVQRRPTKDPRIEAKAAKGNLGDPWIPIRRRDGAAYGNTAPRYDQVAEVLFDTGAWTHPAALTHHPFDPVEMLALFQILVRGQGKTEGYFERTVPLRRHVLELFGDSNGRESLAKRAREQVQEARKLLALLRGALIVLLQNGPDQPNWQDPQVQRWAAFWRREADREIDERFFDFLFDRIETGEPAAHGWYRFLRELAERTLERAVDEAPLASARRLRAIASASNFLRARLNRTFPVDQRETANAV